MPHISVKCYPGRTEEQKRILAQRITNDVMEVLDCPEKSVSVSIQEITQDKWDVEVWDKEIAPQKEYLYKKPGYTKE
jgi:4-oxalocrotonate tautomerase